MSGSAAAPRLTRWLEQASAPVFASVAIAAAFTAYFCMYGVRKPFAAAAWDGELSLYLIIGTYTISRKNFYIIAQVLGYCLSKFIGIKVISEMGGRRRALALVLFIVFAELALVGFALTPAPYNALLLFCNGLPLGMVWGLVFGFLEGRRLSEVLGAGLSASYIVASGAVKSLGAWLIKVGLPDVWMPAVTGALFLPPLLLAAWTLARLPPPSVEDERLRTQRAPMDGPTRRRFVRAYAPGLLFLTALYVLLTAYRDFRDNFATDIWEALGYADAPEILALSELPITIGVLLALALVMAIRDNRRALLVIHGLMLAGSLLIIAATALWQAGALGPVAWMILIGLGLYVGYVPFGCVLFDRLIATVGVVGTAGFMIYVTDAFGYAGSVSILLYKDFGQPDLSWLAFFTGFSYVTGVVTGVCFLASLVYFTWRTRGSRARSAAAP